MRSLPESIPVHSWLLPHPKATRHIRAEKVVRIYNSLDALPFGKTRIHGLEGLFTEPRILSQIDPAAVIQHDIIEMLQKGENPGIRQRDINRQGIAFCRKGKEAGTFFSKPLQNPQKRRATAAGQCL